MNYSKLERKLNEIKTELYIPKGKTFLNVSLRNTLINNNQVKEFPSEWRIVIKEIIQTITKHGWQDRFKKEDTSNMDIIGAKPIGTIMIVDDNGKKYSYDVKSRSINEV